MPNSQNDDQNKKNSDQAEHSSEESKLKLSDALKKVFSVGVGAAFMTEESVRSYLSDLKIPKELLGLVIQGAQKSKDEITNRVSKEMIGMLSKIDFVKEASKFAETHTFKIEINVERKNSSQKEELSK